MQAKLEDTVEITRAMLHGYYEGNLEPWFERLCSKSVWLGAGERVLFGENAIRDYFADYVPQRPVLIKEALIKSTCADLRQKFSLARKKSAGILTDFKVF